MSPQRVEQSPGSSYSHQDIQCDTNPVPDEAVAHIIYFIILPVGNVTKRKKARAVIVEVAAAAAAADPGSSRIAAPADKSTALVVGLLPDAAQLGCLPGPKSA